ncbi:YqaA family protein [Changchengzhania lutea]|uniref:YqaA family protein n=1 Tax=Changchengzhania lutea TaxID=2049305 RepID=UPI001FE3AEEA|nr:VTT domain-containing protein [Changchengzhania lutea]
MLDYFFGINKALVHLTEVLPSYGVLVFFFVSEIVLGLIPPEIFIAWSSKMNSPWLFLSYLAVLSYVGGLISYWIGIYITNLPKVHDYIVNKLQKQLKNSKKWGGFLIMVGAILPLPFSMACMTAGIIEFPFKNVVLYGSLRLVRYAVYGFIIFSAL